MTHNKTHEVRAWCMDYSLRTPRAASPTPHEVVADAKIYEQYVRGEASATVLELVTDNNGKKT